MSYLPVVVHNVSIILSFPCSSYIAILLATKSRYRDIETNALQSSPSGKDVTKDTVEDRNAATPHPSAEQDMKKIAEEKKKIGTDHETEKGGNEGNAEAFDK